MVVPHQRGVIKHAEVAVAIHGQEAEWPIDLEEGPMREGVLPRQCAGGLDARPPIGIQGPHGDLEPEAPFVIGSQAL